MKKYSTVMADLLRVLPRHRIREVIQRSGADRGVRSLSTFQLLTTILYGQITKAFSFREIEHGLSVHANRLYHSGMVAVKRSTLSDAMSKRSSSVFEQIYHELVAMAVRKAGDSARHFKNPLRAIDSTTIPLSIERFDWAKFRKAKGAMKLHVAYDIDSQMPTQAICTHASIADVQVLPRMAHGQAIFVMDRGYLSFNRLYEKEIRGERYVTRVRYNTNCRKVRQFSRPVTPGVKSDLVVKLDNPRRHIDYPAPARLVEYQDPVTQKQFRFLTNVWDLSAQQIADIYKARWQVELFFKWIKQNLKIKTFWGTSRNAVELQIWAALILYVLIWIHRSMMTVDFSMQRLTQMIRLSVFHHKTIVDLVRPPDRPPPAITPLLWATSGG